MSFTRSTGPAPNWPSLVPIVTGVASSYTPLATDYYIGVNGPGVTIALPTGAIAGKTYLIKDESGLVASNPAYRVTITGSALIDGSSSIVMTQSYMSLSVLWTGTFWSII
jgi:hypothetical protein